MPDNLPSPLTLCRQAYREQMRSLWQLYGRPTITSAQIDVYWDALGWLRADIFQAACREYIMIGKHFPRPAEILECCELFLPPLASPEQAWLEVYDAWYQEVQASTVAFQPGDWLDQEWRSLITRSVIQSLGGMWATPRNITYYKLCFEQEYMRQARLHRRRLMAADQPVSIERNLSVQTETPAADRRASSA